MHEVFKAVNHIDALARLKADIKHYRIARDEEGLQLVDADISFLLKRYHLRLTYTCVPDKYCELKMLKGTIKRYEYCYELKRDDAATIVTVSCHIALPLLYCIAQPLLYIRLKRRMKKELLLLQKLLQTKNNT